MHVLEYLSDPKCTRRPQNALSAEYRLLCSGTIFRQINGDWSKSEIARFLLAPPLLHLGFGLPTGDVVRAESKHGNQRPIVRLFVCRYCDGRSMAKRPLPTG
jgi:hypothetical protein